MSVYLIHFNLCTPVSNSVCIDEMNALETQNDFILLIYRRAKKYSSISEHE